MKQHDTGDFCMLYVEPTDERLSLFNEIIRQKKPVVIMLAERAKVLQRPDDYVALKRLKHQHDVSIMFVLPGSERLGSLASRNGFPVYPSMDALTEALTPSGRLPRQRMHTTVPLSPPSAGLLPTSRKMVSKKTRVLSPEMVTAIPPEAPAMPPGSHEEYPRLQRQSSRRRFPVALIVLTMLMLVGAGLGYALVIVHPFTTLLSPTIGHLRFLSSEQLSENSSQGINDQVQIDFSGIAEPAAQKSYYAWLLGDKNQPDTKAILLGVLPVNKGSVHLFYAGDTAHTNLLEKTSRFLVTEEDAAVMPIAPSPDTSTWRYYGEFAQTPATASGNGSRYLDHLRHLLASDPLLDEMELPGGLNNWLYRNTGKILEWSSSMREHWEETPDVSFIRRQTIRTLAYLDGLTYVHQDMPSNMPLGINDRLARVGILEVNGPNQDPPCYLNHIVLHMNGLLQASSQDVSMRKSASGIISALSSVRSWLTEVRQDALQILKMSDEQLHSPTTLSLLNDMIQNANSAYVGQPDASTGEMHQGVTWIHTQIQALAVLDVALYQPGSSNIQMIPNTQQKAV